ncbi:MAG: nucleoside hydrolase [Schleiferilactobacillus harbinensis]|jgi:inosine-uridine nucleoside N-ribohydrolase|nr:nucleoside hydrolase [Schleiferilactobacillus harbinensis]MCI1911985.1 nucleoside hydrolase [Schleiferilactobacillus harbinensis]
MSDLGLPPMTPHRPLRVLICSDAKNEADDQFAIAHALLTPRFAIQGLIAGHFGLSGSVDQSLTEMQHIAALMKRAAQFPIVKGAEAELSTDGRPSAGSRLIIDTARSTDSRPLFVLCMGTLTDVATALRQAPDIASRMTAIWVGGGRYPHGSNEANLHRDRLAANEVFASAVPLWQIPSQAYKTMLAPIAELRLRVAPAGPLGRYLYTQLVNFANAHVTDKPWINSECWVLGDSAAVGVLLDEQKGNYAAHTPPFFNADCSHDMVKWQNRRPIRIYHQLNTRMILADCYAKLALQD